MAGTRKTKVRARPGGRSARVVRDVLAAAIDVFAESGYAGFSFEDVAARAGVNKTTVYRRWATKSELVGAAVLAMREADETPDTGNIRGDLQMLLEQRVKRLSSPRGRSVARALLTSAMEPELAAIVAMLRKEHPTIPDVVFDRAIARGELPKNVDRALLAEALVAPILTRVLWKGMGASSSFVASLVELLLGGAAT
ncbi:MAG: TetR/AcrR family transcriptional regulator [Polyangiales bacterium]